MANKVTLSRLDTLAAKLRKVAAEVRPSHAAVFTDRAEQVELWARRLRGGGTLDQKYVLTAVEEFEALCRK